MLILPKDSLNIEIELFPQRAISHENQSFSQIFCLSLQFMSFLHQFVTIFHLHLDFCYFLLFFSLVTIFFALVCHFFFTSLSLSVTFFFSKSITFFTALSRCFYKFVTFFQWFVFFLNSTKLRLKDVLRRLPPNIPTSLGHTIWSHI